MNKVAIYILTKDRLNFATLAIKSALSNSNADVIISDCSAVNKLENHLKNIKCHNGSSLTYIHRGQSLEQFNHIRKIISENKHEFFTIFHDDDILYPNYVQTMLNIHLKYDLIAAGCNYRLINKNGDFIKDNTFYMPKGVVASSSFLNTYCKISFARHPCFSGYMYNSKLLRGISPNHNEGGTWSDFAFLLKLSQVGNIYWTPKKLMSYRIHGNNISAKEKIIHRISMTNFIIRNFNKDKYSDEILQYKLKYLSKFRSHKNLKPIYNKLLLLALRKSPTIILKIIFVFFSRKIYDQRWIS